MAELLIRRLPACEHTKEEIEEGLCEHGWSTAFCCPEMQEYFSDSGEGGPFYIEATGRAATGFQLDVSGGLDLVTCHFCPFCGAASRVVDELPERKDGA